MKKILVIFLLTLLVIPFVFAQGNKPETQGNKSGSTTTTLENTIGNSNQVSNQGEDDTISEQERDQNRTMLQNVTQIRERIRERKQEIEEELKNKTEKEQKVWRNQNLVRETVHNLLDMKDALDLKGGIGQNVSEIAREFNNSVQATIRAEERIQNKSWFRRFLFGGDSDAADEIEQEVNRNMERIQELNKLKEQIKDDEELKQLLQDQIQQIEQEVNRLQELMQKEKKSKGLFGWLFR